jgi:hypothetical protein
MVELDPDRCSVFKDWSNASVLHCDPNPDFPLVVLTMSRPRPGLFIELTFELHLRDLPVYFWVWLAGL